MAKATTKAKAAKSYKNLFKQFLNAQPERLHFAAHSHHPWPDVTLAAQTQCWLDAAHLIDDKWDYIFETIVPAAQQHIARRLNLPEPQTIAFAPNTHSFVTRLFSCLGHGAKVLSTDSEFHSLTRQIKRLAEDSTCTPTLVPTEPFVNFPQRFIEAARQTRPDMVFLSHVFFNSGYAIPHLATFIDALTDVVPPETLIVIDGYHGFMALPTDLGPISERVFYLAGGYKYAMSGEGVCFMHCPRDYAPRPTNTGWYASFGSLTHNQQADTVPYGPHGMRFWGATFDPVGLYRLNAVMDMFDAEDLTVEKIHAHVQALQQQFITALKATPAPNLPLDSLLPGTTTKERGHFLTFDLPHAGKLCTDLKTQNIMTDTRHTRLRLGFGVYHDAGDVKQLVDVLRKV